MNKHELHVVELFRLEFLVVRIAQLCCLVSVLVAEWELQHLAQWKTPRRIGKEGLTEICYSFRNVIIRLHRR